MGKFVFVYRGGARPTSEDEGAKVMEAWMGWFGTLGAAVVDGATGSVRQRQWPRTVR